MFTVDGGGSLASSSMDNNAFSDTKVNSVSAPSGLVSYAYRLRPSASAYFGFSDLTSEFR